MGGRASCDAPLVPCPESRDGLRGGGGAGSPPMVWCHAGHIDSDWPALAASQPAMRCCCCRSTTKLQSSPVVVGYASPQRDRETQGEPILSCFGHGRWRAGILPSRSCTEVVCTRYPSQWDIPKTASRERCSIVVRRRTVGPLGCAAARVPSTHHSAHHTTLILVTADLHGGRRG
jgi:hypothetical protein